MPNQPFTAVTDGNSGTLINGLLVPGGGDLLIQNGQLVPQVIQGISRIFTENTPGIFRQRINVFGRTDEEGLGTIISFQDQSPDTYTLSILSPVPINHTILYNSSMPTIILVAWTALLAPKKKKLVPPGASAIFNIAQNSGSILVTNTGKSPSGFCNIDGGVRHEMSGEQSVAISDLSQGDHTFNNIGDAALTVSWL